MTPDEPRFATDVITFYHPAFWNLESPDAVRELALSDPARFWERVLDALAEAEVTGIELTFAPGDIESALRAFGSAPAFRRELESRGLSVVSAFIADSDAPDWRQGDNLPAIVADAERRAAFLAEAGRTSSSPGCPCGRRSGHARPSSSTPRTCPGWPTSPMRSARRSAGRGCGSRSTRSPTARSGTSGTSTCSWR